MTTHGIQFAKRGTGRSGPLSKFLSAHHAHGHGHTHGHAAGATYGKRFHIGTTRAPSEPGTAAARPVDAAAKHDALVTQTEKWVAQTFYGTMLKQSHSSTFKDKLFGGGRGGETFGAMLDQHLAEHMSRGAGGKLVDQIVHQIEHPKGGPA